MTRLLILLAVTTALHADVATTRETLRQRALHLINRDRVAAALQPLAHDPEASRFADAYCRLQIRNRTTGHFTTDGLAPYTRYSAAGIDDALLENTAGWSAPQPWSERALVEMVQRSHEAMMGEQPPADGHRRAILDAHATHAAVGVAWEGGEFRLVHLVLRRLVAWDEPFPRSARAGQAVSGRGTPIGGTVEAITVHHEPLPRPLLPAEASARSEYALPSTRREYLPRANGALTAGSGPMAARRDSFVVLPDGAFRFTLPQTDGAGIYTVVVWVRKGDAVVAASNVSIRVDPADAGGVSAGR